MIEKVDNLLEEEEALIQQVKESWIVLKSIQISCKIHKVP